MAGTPFRKGKGGAGRFVQLPEWLQASEAWRTLQPGPKVLYIELKRRFNGSNNGQIFLSHRDAAKALNVHRNTVGPWFKELEERGFIRLTKGPHLGPSGVGKASVWALDEEATSDMKPARKRFMSWSEKQNPRTKNRTARHSECDSHQKQQGKTGETVRNIVPLSAKSRKAASQ